MKKILSFLVMGLVTVLPLTVDAASKINYECGEFDADGVRTCSVGYTIDSDTPQSSITVYLTEHGGAEVTEVNVLSDSEFTGTPSEGDGVWTVSLASPDSLSGEFSLFTFKYKNSGEEDCKVTISIGNDNKDVEETDTPTENVKTGATLPFIALGTIAVIAGGAYVVTKNKSKMYKI